MRRIKIKVSIISQTKELRINHAKFMELSFSNNCSLLSNKICHNMYRSISTVVCTCKLIQFSDTFASISRIRLCFRFFGIVGESIRYMCIRPSLHFLLICFSNYVDPSTKLGVAAFPSRILLVRSERRAYLLLS